MVYGNLSEQVNCRRGSMPKGWAGTIPARGFPVTLSLREQPGFSALSWRIP